MVAAPVKANRAPPRDRSKTLRPASKLGFTDSVPWHWLTPRSVGSATGVPSAPRHGELNAGSVKPRVKFSSSFVALIEPPILRLCAPDVYVRSTLPPKFVKVRSCDIVAGS